MEHLQLAINEIRSKMPRLELRLEEPMKNHCSFRIGGPAAAMALPGSQEETEELCHLLRRMGVRPFVMGNGTNLLVTDRPLRRIVIKMGEKMGVICAKGETSLTAGCGATLARLATAAQGLGLSGLEFAHGIPGTLGGAVVMNAGAYGGEMRDVVMSTTFLDEDLSVSRLTGQEHDFSYRHSAFSDRNCVILSCDLELRPGDPQEIRRCMKDLAERRRSSQPLDMPSAGSTFKRPEKGYAAALIDQAGLKGYTVGGAQVSEKHAGFVVNRGGASFDDVIRVMEHVRETVYKTAGIMLEPEIKIIT
ncbi:MAG: UDP-N-acetylmuramate dehydrogenase [Oscillospiraceae bacterium]|jgi:UDP-N-acetylmuramate dehydrogenase